MSLQYQSAAESPLALSTELAVEDSLDALVFDPDVASEAGGGGEGALTLAARELLNDLVMLLGHMGNVVIFVVVAGVARSAAPP